MCYWVTVKMVHISYVVHIGISFILFPDRGRGGRGGGRGGGGGGGGGGEYCFVDI